MGSFLVYLSVTMLMIIGVLMIFIILLQRGRGGGLAGAFGGAGGQSALGTKAGDVFTKITVGLAVVWVFFACLSIYALRYQANAWAAELPDQVETEEGTITDGEEGTGAETPAPSTAPPETTGAGAAGSESAGGEGESAAGTSGAAANAAENSTPAEGAADDASAETPAGETP